MAWPSEWANRECGFGVPYPAMKRAILVAAVVLSAARCATMVNDTTEKIPVRSTPAGAVVSVDCGNAPLYGGVVADHITGLNPDAIAGSIYSATTAAAAAPADAFDARKGGAYKQVPGEVEVTLDPEPTTPSPPR